MVAGYPGSAMLVAFYGRVHNDDRYFLPGVPLHLLPQLLPCPLIFIVFLRHQAISFIVYQIRKLIRSPGRGLLIGLAEYINALARAANAAPV